MPDPAKGVLEPCPFCESPGYKGIMGVTCTNRHCSVSKCAIPLDQWNRRALTAPSQGGWVSVGERLPTHNYSVLARVIKGGLVIDDEQMTDICSYEPSRGWLQFVGHDNEKGDNDYDRIVEVSHWQPLPAPPCAPKDQPEEER